MARLANYAYSNARLRAKLGKLLSAQQYEAIMAASDIEEACEALRYTEYRDIFDDVRTLRNIRHLESALVGRLIAAHRDVAAHAKGNVSKFLSEFMRKYEVENLKVILRVWNANLDEEKEFIYRDRICYEIPVASILEAASFEEVIVLLEDTPYRKPLTEAREKYKEANSLFYPEVALDRQLYVATWNAIGDLSGPDRKIAAKLIGIEIDILNINWIVRFRRYYNLSLAEITSLMLPNGYQISEQFLRDVYPAEDQESLLSQLLTGLYKGVSDLLQVKEETEALHLLEALLREMFVGQIKHALGGFPFTIGVAIAYLRLKKMEISNIITILNGKALRLPRDQIERNVVNF